MYQKAVNNHELLSQSNGCVITIDGPAASGKSTVARHLAKKLGFIFVSSGYYYRALAWGVLQKKLEPSQENKIASWLQTLDFQTTIIEGEARPLLNNCDPKEHLFDPGVNALVSPLAALPEVRKFLLTKLRNLSLDHNLVIEGRDIGSVVFPDTPFKFYLDASLEERMRRRHQEGEIDAIAERDRSDSSRAVAPLLIPDGARVIDTTHLSIGEVAEHIFQCIQEKTQVM
ncbi:MAG: (d)CMP kinase [Verrucomicrobiae bacterium]|jgi:cytidylate kinase|nr:(d)CMP kinase [Verrucomicrobiae bacterium]